MNILSLVRPNILSMLPYSSARSESKLREGIFLDANENPYGTLNRYPDPNQQELKSRLSRLKQLPVDRIFVGNGSDELIDLVIRIFCNPGKDKIIICPPTYGMYEVAAHLNDVEVIQVPLDSEFQLNTEAILNIREKEEDVKMIFLCSPNNPTGNILKDVEVILAQFNGIVFLDEAYIDFSNSASLLSLLRRFPRLIVSQTMSKAWGLAAARIGIGYANEEIISFLNKVKPPYNISRLNESAAIEALDRFTIYERDLQKILIQRTRLETELSNLGIVHKVYPSEANFLLVEMADAAGVYRCLTDRNIIIRNRSSVIENCLRISVGTETENTILINELNKLNT